MTVFQWIEIYRELAERLLTYENRQVELIRILREIGKDPAIAMMSVDDLDESGDRVPLQEIDPFTVFSAFNRQIKNESRQAIILALQRALGLGPRAPEHFQGIPRINNQKAWFFPYVRNRDPGDIPALWKLAQDAVRGGLDALDPENFRRCIAIKGVGIAKLTMALFWVRADEFIPLDKNTRRLLADSDLRVAGNDLESYGSVVHQFRARFNESFADYSRKARESAKKARPSPDPVEPPEPDAEREVPPLNSILYGPPGTGKTYQTFRHAVEIVDGAAPSARDAVLARYRELQERNQIEFVTFHQSYSYEDFVEGIRPTLETAEPSDEGSAIRYECRPGTFRNIASLAAAAGSRSTSAQEFDATQTTVWKMSLGNTLDASQAEIFEAAIQEQRLYLGYGQDIDFSGCEDQPSVATRLAERYPQFKDDSFSSWAVDRFKNQMSVGDLVVVSDGNHKFRAIGRVAGDYEHDRGATWPQSRPVNWLFVPGESLPRQKIIRKAFSQMTIYRISPSILVEEGLSELLAGPGHAAPENHVLIIDEINRGNVSKIFGELITLLEDDKRIGGENEIRVKLPYSGDSFGVPGNLYVIGTMNTADRSIALIDNALRRRFDFIEITPDPSVVRSHVGAKGLIADFDVARLMSVLNERIEALYDRDHTLGHSYFLRIDTLEDLRDRFASQIIPLLQEYFFEDADKVCSVLGCSWDLEGKKPQCKNDDPVFVCERISAPQASAGFGEGHFRYQVNSKFLRASSEEIRPFLLGILESENTATLAE